MSWLDDRRTEIGQWLCVEARENVREGERENKEMKKYGSCKREEMRGKNQAVGDGQLKLFHWQKWRTKCKGALDGEGERRGK